LTGPNRCHAVCSRNQLDWFGGRCRDFARLQSPAIQPAKSSLVRQIFVGQCEVAAGELSSRSLCGRASRFSFFRFPFPFSVFPFSLVLFFSSFSFARPGSAQIVKIPRRLCGVQFQLLDDVIEIPCRFFDAR